MTHDAQLEQLIASGPAAGPAAGDAPADLRRLGAVPVELSVELGRTRMTVGDTLELREGAVITLDRLSGDPVDLLVNGTAIARGEIVVIDEQFGLRLTEVLQHATAPAAAVAGPPAPEPSVDPTLGAAA